MTRLVTSGKPSEPSLQESGQNVSSNSISSLLSDAPPATPEDGLLRYEDYQNALINIIEGHAAETSLTIGVFGPWGSGKTTLLEWVKDGLEDRNKVIWVNLWQFGAEEDVWVAFLQSLFLKVKEEMNWYRRLLFNLGLLKRRIDWSLGIKRGLELLARIAVAILPLYFSLSYFISLLQQSSLVPATVAAGAGTILSTVLGWYALIQPSIKAINERVRLDLTSIVKASPLRERVSVLDQVKEFLEDMIVSLAGEGGRVVVFIDDLDRRPPDRIVQVLDALKVFLDVRNCAYVIGLDRDIVEQAIKTKFEEYDDPIAESREYLE